MAGVTKTIIDFATVVGTFIGIGLFFDQVLVSDATRKRVKNFIISRVGEVKPSEVFFSYIRLINEAVFSRYFSYPIFSWRYFGVCAYVSVISLGLLVLAQFLIFGPPTTPLVLTGFQIGFLILCVVFNVVVDWISIAQTQTFFAITTEQKNPWRAALLVASDFLLTINFFTLLYAQLVSYVLVLGQAAPYSANLKAIAYDLLLKPEQVQELRHGGNPAGTQHMAQVYDISLYGDAYSEAGRGSPFRIRMFADTQDVTIKDLLALSSDFVAYRTSKPDYYFRLGGLRERDKDTGEKVPFSQRGSAEWKTTDERSGSQEHQDIAVTVPSLGMASNRALSYTIAYRTFDMVQDEFPASFLREVTVLSLSKLYDEYFIELGGLSGYRYGCWMGGDVGGQWTFGFNPSVLTENCQKRLTVSVQDLHSLLASVVTAAPNVRNVKLPLNSLFLTSLSITFLIYAFALFLVISRLVSSKVLGGAATLESYFMRAPFACVGMVLGVVVYIVSLLS